MNGCVNQKYCTKQAYSIENLARIIKEGNISMTHPSQRAYDQWTLAVKSELVSDVLQGFTFNDVILAEQLLDGGRSIIWNIDGKQRCNTLIQYLHNEFRISRKVTRFMIEYMGVQHENGNVVRNASDGAIRQVLTFDIRGKFFEDLPIELQHSFREYMVNTTLYRSCSKEDIAYHIRRYNLGKSMNKSQIGMTRMSYEVAEKLKLVTRNNFFRDCCSFGKTAEKNGVFERAVVEALMASDYIDHWSKNVDEACAYLDSKDDGIDALGLMDEILGDLHPVIEEQNDIIEMLNDKDTYIWLALYKRNYDKLYDNPALFVDFMREVSTGDLSDRSYGGVANDMTYREFCDPDRNRATKDKAYVSAKLDLLQCMLEDFLGVCDVTNDYADTVAIDEEENCVGPMVGDIDQDVIIEADLVPPGKQTCVIGSMEPDGAMSTIYGTDTIPASGDQLPYSATCA